MDRGNGSARGLIVSIVLGALAIYLVVVLLRALSNGAPSSLATSYAQAPAV
jgi:hypothetical protein